MRTEWHLAPVAVIEMPVNTGPLLAIVGLVATASIATAQPAASPTDVADDEGHGPPVELPGPVPDFVRDVVDLIGQGRSAPLSGQELGDALSGLLDSDRTAGPTG